LMPTCGEWPKMAVCPDALDEGLFDRRAKL
jgi:hypothetical protein